jgi:hypothetical protein
MHKIDFLFIDAQNLIDTLIQKIKLASIHVSFQICVFSTKLFALAIKNSNDTTESLLNSLMNDYFDLVKTELYSIILKCNENNDEKEHLDYLKVCLLF